MIRMKYHAPGTPPATLVAKPKAGTGAPVLTLIQYDGDSIFEEEFDTFEGLMRRFDPSKVNWINVEICPTSSCSANLGTRSISTRWLWRTS